MTEVNKVRLRIGDLGSVIFTSDDYIQEFLDANDGSVVAACADACLAMATDAVLLHRAWSAGNYKDDKKGMAEAYRKMAGEFRAQAATTPAYAHAEQAVSDFAAGEIVLNEELREG